MSATAQDTVVLCIEGVDMPGSSEGLRCGGRVGEGADSGGTVMGRDSCGASFYLVDGDSEGGS